MGGMIYLFFYVIIYSVLCALNFKNYVREVSAYIDLAMTIVSVVGMFGYARGRKAGPTNLWREWLFFQVGWDICTQILSPPDYLPTPALGIFVFMLFVPKYVMLYRYGSGAGDEG